MRIASILLVAIALSVCEFVPALGGEPPSAPEKEKEKVGDSTAGAKAPVTVKEARRDSVYFSQDVMPLLGKLGCNQMACHGSQVGKGGFRLSMFGGDPEYDYEALTRLAGGRRVNQVEPQKSLMLLKATGAIPHQGAQKLQVGSKEYEMLASWIAQGVPWSDEQLPKLVSLKVAAGEQVLQKGQTQQLLATAVYADGSEKDITRLAAFTPTDAKVVVVEGDGRIKAENYGQAAVVASYLRRCSVVRVLVPQPLPGPFPAVAANNKVDELVFANLKKLGIPPADLCTDHVFLRRVYLDTIGTLPTPSEARAFLADSDAQKRSKLIDRLLERDEFADFWTLKWGDLLRIKSEYPVNLWPKAAQTYYRWVRESIAKNKPYDQFVRELVTASGSNFRNGAVNFSRAVPKKDAQTLAESAALVFMGARIGCARCHGHPLENCNLDDDLGMAAFFAKVSYKQTQEWKEEIVYSNPKRDFRHPKTRDLVKPKFLGGDVLELDKEEDPRVKFADWLVSPQNPWFAKNIVNRVWFWLLGRGIVHEPDDLRPTNPPENPELLAYLEQELVGQKYDLKHVYRLILNSRTYQLASRPGPGSEQDVAHFSHYQAKRLGAEQLLDAVDQITEASETFASRIPEPYTRLPPGYRATQLPDANIEAPFLELFGRPPRDTPYETERSAEISLWHALYFVNSNELENKVNNGQRIKRLIKEAKSDADIVDEFYLAGLSRLPNEEEKRKVLDYISERKNAREQAIRDILWAILNTKEFLFNH